MNRLDTYRLAPPPPPHLPRAALCARLARSRAAVLLCAPSGFGKSSLARALVADAAHVGWYQVAATDGDLVLHYLDAALAQAAPHGDRPPVPQGAAAQVVWCQTVLRQLAADPRPGALVIDDAHLLPAQPLLPWLSGVIAACPHLQIVLTTRLPPVLPDLTLLRARGRVLVVDEPALRLTDDESCELYTHLAGAPPTPAVQLDTLDGWAAGVVLTALRAATGAAPDPHARFAELAIALLADQPVALQTFLLRASLLEYLTPQTIAQLGDVPDAAALLDQAVSRQLFLRPHDGGYVWHPLFHTVLQQTARARDPQGTTATARTIADAAIAGGDARRAVTVALRSADPLLLAAVLATVGDALLLTGGALLDQALATLDPLPSSLLPLAGERALARGDYDRAHTLVRQLPHDAGGPALLFAARVARIDGDYPTAVALATAAAAALTGTRRAHAARLVAITTYRMGAHAHAVSHLRDLIASGAADASLAAQLQHDLAIALRGIGDEPGAAAAAARAADAWTQQHDPARATMALVTVATLARMRGHTHDASRVLDAAQQASRAAGGTHAASVAIARGDLQVATGDLAGAAAAYATAAAAGGTSAYLRADLARAQFRLAVWTGDRAQACALRPTLLAADDADDAGSVQLASAALDAQLGDVAAAAQTLQALAATSVAAGRHRMAARAQHLGAALTGTPPVFIDPAWQAICAADARLVAPRAAWIPPTVIVPALAPPLVAHLLGQSHVTYHGAPLPLVRRAPWSLLYLLLAYPQGMPRTWLCEALWPEQPARARGRALSDALYQLRRALGDSAVLQTGGGTYTLATGLARDDMTVLRDHVIAVQAGAVPDPALLLTYDGPYLPHVDAAWADDLRRSLAAGVQLALHRAAGAAGDTTTACALFTLAVREDPLDEAAQAGLIQALCQLGRTADALRHAARLRATLQTTFGDDQATDPQLQQVLAALPQSAEA